MAEPDKSTKCITSEHTIGEAMPSYLTTLCGTTELCRDQLTFAGFLSLGNKMKVERSVRNAFNLGPWQASHPNGFRRIEAWAYPNGFVARLVLHTNSEKMIVIGLPSTAGLRRVPGGPEPVEDGKVQRIYEITYGTSLCEDGRSYLRFIRPKYLDEKGRPIAPGAARDEKQEEEDEEEEEEEDGEGDGEGDETEKDEEEDEQEEEDEKNARGGRGGGRNRGGKRQVTVTTSFIPEETPPRSHPVASSSESTSSTESKSMWSPATLTLIGAGVFFLLLAIWWWRRRKAQQEEEGSQIEEEGETERTAALPPAPLGPGRAAQHPDWYPSTYARSQRLRWSSS